MSTPNDAVQILLVGGDATLRAEFDSAVAGVRSQRIITHHARDHRQGLDAARFRAPDVICVAIAHDLGPLKAFARDVLAVAPDALLAAVYRRDDVGVNGSEGEMIIEALRARAQDFLRRPVSSTELQQLLDGRLRRAAPPVTHQGTVISVVSNRGGVGKSTLAVNVAVKLALRHPGRVLLVDASLQHGVCATMLDLVPATTIVDAAREHERVDETMLVQLTTSHESGLRLLASAKDAVDAVDLSDDIVGRVIGLARRTFDYVIVDTFPILDSVLLAVLDLTDMLYVVTQSTVPGVNGVVGLLRALEQLAVSEDRVRIVVSHNFPRFIGDLRLTNVEAALKREIDHFVPYDKRLLRAANIGRPLARRTTGVFGFGRAIGRIVKEVESVRSPAPDGEPVRRFPFGLFRREPAEAKDGDR